jgi:signal transduction histidine kinase
LLRLALNNLVENALKYSPADKSIQVTLTADQKFIRISVKDEGTGIASAEKKKIFEKFYRIGDENTRRAKGTGLGLYLTSKIIEDHKGVVFVEDNTPSGSTFVIQLPKNKA